MKKMYYVFATVVMTLLISSVVFADPLATLDTKEGTVDIVGYTIDKDDGKDIFVGLFEYTNTSDESKSPDYDFMFYAYQDGIELEQHYNSEYVYKKYKPDDTKVRPGSTVKFYELFEMPGNGSVDVEVKEFFSLDNKQAEYTFDLSNDKSMDVSSDNESSVDSSDTDWEAKYNKLLKKYKKLEKKYKKLKSKMG